LSEHRCAGKDVVRAGGSVSPDAFPITNPGFVIS